MKDVRQPLVSIIVITYNSSKYVLETLESAKAQTYQNIELIVSDDCSTDNTVEICSKWIEENKVRFIRTKLITVEKNTGTPANFNRSIKATQGEWIKSIAGDDLLDELCIDQFMKVAFNDDFKYSIMVSNKCTFRNDTNDINVEKISSIMSTSPQKQLPRYACERPTIAPFIFIKKDVLVKLSGFDETYHLLEDSPFFFKALKNNYYFRLVDCNLVYYRLSNDSISNTDVISDKFKNELIKFNNNTVKPYLISRGFCFNAFKLNINLKVENKPRMNFLLRVIYKLAKIELDIFLS